MAQTKAETARTQVLRARTIETQVLNTIDLAFANLGKTTLRVATFHDTPYKSLCEATAKTEAPVALTASKILSHIKKALARALAYLTTKTLQGTKLLAIKAAQVLKLLATKTLKATKHLRKTLYRTIKRLFDIFVGLIGCLLTLPVLAGVKIYNLKHNDHAPLLYAQVRIGKNGKLFKVYKIRSMVANADAKLAKLLEENAALRTEWEQNHKLKNDPRITRVGRFLRKTSLDEFPQFWNILIGEMSLVGPRPLAVGELDLHGGDHALYESVKPGLTGWWGANGRSDTDYDSRLHLEYFYAKNASLSLDMACIFRTTKSILKREGAV